MKPASWLFLTARDFGNQRTPEYIQIPAACSLATRCDREIIRGAARARPRKVPPFLRVINKALPRHRSNQPVPPAPLARRDGFRGRMRPRVGTIVTGSHVDAGLWGARARRRGAVGIGLARIERH